MSWSEYNGKDSHRPLFRCIHDGRSSWNIVSRATDAEQLLFSDIDPEEVERMRSAFPVGKDRRDELYHSLLSTTK